MMTKSILIVDDEQEIEIILRDLLKHMDVEIHQIYTGSEALSYFDHNKPDLVLLDLQVPEVNGLEILKHIRNRNLESKVVMITAFATVETAVEAMKFGADDFICKPFTLADLQKVILQQLEGQAILPKSSPISLEDVEKRHIGAVLRQNNGNRRKTAEDLGISLRTLYYKIKQYDLE